VVLVERGVQELGVRVIVAEYLLDRSQLIEVEFDVEGWPGWVAAGGKLDE
jgi:hypothetical protein